MWRQVCEMQPIEGTCAKQLAQCLEYSRRRSWFVFCKVVIMELLFLLPGLCRESSIQPAACGLHVAQEKFIIGLALCFKNAWNLLPTFQNQEVFT